MPRVWDEYVGILWKICRWVEKTLVEVLNWESKKIWKYWIRFMCVFIFPLSFCNFRDVDLTLFNLSALLNCILVYIKSKGNISYSLREYGG